MKKNYLFVAILILSLCLTGCVSDSDYKDLEQRVEQLEKMLGVSHDTSTQINKDSREDIQNNWNDNIEENQMIVDVTSENFDDYFEYVLVEYGDIHNDGNDYYVFVPHSKIFDDGWVYVDTSEDFSLEYYDSWNQSEYGTRRMRKIENTSGLLTLEQEPEFILVDVKGQIRFVKKEALQEYTIDSFKLYRIVRTSDGKGYSQNLIRSQLDIFY